MSFEISYTPQFAKALKRLRKRYKSIIDDVNALVLSLKEDPFQGVDLGKNLRKIRLAITSKGKGKSGGARMITYNLVISENCGTVYLMTIYDKSEKESISDAEITSILKENSFL